MQTIRSLSLVCALLATSAYAVAQAPPTRVTPLQQTAPPPPQFLSRCEPLGQGGANALHDSTVGQSHEPLGDKLAKSDGVLCPPSGIDPEIRAPTPDTGKMPVIPPPGSPGGDPNLRPK
jgi:hypothetical protein